MRTTRCEVNDGVSRRAHRLSICKDITAEVDAACRRYAGRKIYRSRTTSEGHLVRVHHNGIVQDLIAAARVDHDAVPVIG